MLFCSLLLLRPTVTMTKRSRERQKNVHFGKAKHLYTFRAAEKGKCSESSYNVCSPGFDPQHSGGGSGREAQRSKVILSSISEF